MPTKRAGTCALAVGDKIVAMGGVSQTQEPLDNVEMYDIKQKKWTSCDPLRDKIMGISSVVRGTGYLILFSDEVDCIAFVKLSEIKVLCNVLAEKRDSAALSAHKIFFGKILVLSLFF